MTAIFSQNDKSPLKVAWSGSYSPILNFGARTIIGSDMAYRIAWSVFARYSNYTNDGCSGQCIRYLLNMWTGL